MSRNRGKKIWKIQEARETHRVKIINSIAFFMLFTATAIVLEKRTKRNAPSEIEKKCQVGVIHFLSLSLSRSLYLSLGVGVLKRTFTWNSQWGMLKWKTIFLFRSLFLPFSCVVQKAASHWSDDCAARGVKRSVRACIWYAAYFCEAKYKEEHASARKTLHGNKTRAMAFVGGRANGAKRSRVFLVIKICMLSFVRWKSAAPLPRVNRVFELCPHLMRRVRARTKTTIRARNGYSLPLPPPPPLSLQSHTHKPI